MYLQRSLLAPYQYSDFHGNNDCCRLGHLRQPYSVSQRKEILKHVMQNIPQGLPKYPGYKAICFIPLSPASCNI